MTWEIFVGLATAVTAFLPILSVVLKLNRSLVSLEAAVKQLHEYMEKQSGRNHGFSERLMDHERRLIRLESDERRDRKE